MRVLRWLWSCVRWPWYYARFIVHWRKYGKKGERLNLHVSSFKAFAEALDRNDIPYVLLRGFPSRERLYARESKEDFDTLLNALHIKRLLRVAAWVPGRVPVQVYFDLQPSYVNYNYYPPILAQQILANTTIHPDGYSVPAPVQHFLSLAYHVVYHKGMIESLDQPLEQTVLYSKHYAALKALASHPDIQFAGPFTLMALHTFLRSRQFTMPFDLLKKWPVRHPLLMILYEQEREELRKTAPRGFPLALTVRSDAPEHDDEGATTVAEAVSQQLKIDEIIKLNEEQVRNLSLGSRGGKWIEERKLKFFDVPPTHVIVCRFDSRDDIDQFCAKELPGLKKRIRDHVNQKHPHPIRKHRYVIHGPDDFWESLDCLRLIGHR